MENLNWLEKVTGLLALLLPSLVTLWLGRMQAANQRRKDELQGRLDSERGKADNLLDFSTAAKNMGETWDEIVSGLRTEITRIKQTADEREKKLLSDLEGLRRQLQNNQAQLDSVMEHEMIRKQARDELEKRLTTVTTENRQLHTQIVELQGDNLRLQTELNDTRDEVGQLRVENGQLRETIRVLRNDMNRIEKKVTGQLPPAPAKGQP